MKTSAHHDDPAFAAMTLDLLGRVLSRADHPGKQEELLAEELRELTGARCVVLIECPGSETVMEHRVISVNPARRRGWADSPAAHRLYEIIHRLPAAHLWRPGESSAAGEILRAEGFELSQAIPLNAGSLRVGAMLLLGLPDDTRLDSALGLLHALSSIVALTLRNAFLYEKQERLVGERTRELQVANDSLRENDQRIRALLVDTERTKKALLGLLEDQQQVEAALRESEQQYRTLIDNLPSGVVVHGPDTSILLSNALASSVFGLTAEQMRGKTAMDPRWCFFEEDGSPMPLGNYPVNRMLASGEGFKNLLVGVSRPDRAKPAWMLCNAFPVRDPKGQIVQAVITFTDITERKQAEATLRESEFRLKQAQQVARLGHYDLDTRSGDWTSSEMLDTLFGIDATYPKTVAGWSQLLHPADREALLAYLLDQVLKGKQPFDRVYRIVRANDGNTCWVHGLGQLRCNAAGEVIGMFGIIQDITARKQLEMAVARERQLLRALIDHLPDAIYAKDSLGRKTLANPADVRFLGRATEAEVLGQDDFAFYPPEMAAKFFADDQAVIATGQPVLNFEDLFTDAQGHQQWLLCSKLPLRGADGEVIGLVGVGRDITERKQAEAEIHKLNAELEQRVVDRTAQLELVNQQLSAENTARRQAEEFVRGRNEELKSFAYTVSHDLKAPLRGISGYANELDRRHRAGLEERALFCIGQILTATRNLDHLIEDLLRFSRLDAEMPSLSRLDLRALVETILHDRSLIITEQRVEVTVNIPLITMEAWERGVAQVLANLIDNALKYSRQAQPPRLTITAEARPDGCRLTVADNGIGFDMKYHDRIFGLFNRLVRSDQFEGTGAGLAIVKKLMEKLGGKIRAESGPGQGATFFVELPNQPKRKNPL